MRQLRPHLFVLMTTIIGSFLLFWPLLISESGLRNLQLIGAPSLTFLMIPTVIALVINEALSLTFNVKQLSVIAIIIAVAVAVRPFGIGIAGIEPIWIVIIIAGCGMGPIAGFIVGASAIATSAVVTGGVGPWLPYQMFLAALIGYGAGFVKHPSRRIEVFLLATYGAVVAFLFGWLMNLWFWPTAIGLDPAIAFDVSSTISERISAWARFSVLTSLGIDVPRAILTSIGLALIAASLLRSIRSSFRPATFSISSSSID